MGKRTKSTGGGLILQRQPGESVIIEGVIEVQVHSVKGQYVKLRFKDLTDHKCRVARKEIGYGN